MLLFSQPVPGVANTFNDHSLPARAYYLPDGLALAAAADGRLAFHLLRYAADFSEASGGLLQLILSLERSDLADLPPAEWRPAPFERALLRLRVRSLLEGADEAGLWRQVVLSGGDQVTVTLFLDQTEQQFLQKLLEGGADVVQADLRLLYRGLASGFPYLVTARRAALNDMLTAMIGDRPVAPAEVLAAFLTLMGTAVLTFQPFEAAPALPAETLMTEAAWRALPLFFQSEEVEGEMRYRLQLLPPAADDRLNWSLQPYRIEERSHNLAWSLSDWQATLVEPAERARYFPIVTRITPFIQATVHVVNSLPLDPAHLRQVRVDVRYPGSNGLPVNQTALFADGESIQRFTTTFPALTTPFHLEYRLTCILAPPAGGGFPLIWPPDRPFMEAPSQLMLEITRALAGIDFVEVSAAEDVFDLCRQLECFVWPGQEPAAESEATGVILTGEKTAAWASLPGVAATDPLYVRCRVLPLAGLDGAAVTLYDGPVVGRRLAIYRFQLEVVDPDLVTARLVDDAPARFAFVAVAFRPHGAPEADEGRLFTLEFGQPAIYAIWRPSIFETARYQWRTFTVPLDENGKTLPLVEGVWATSSAHELILGAEGT